ncbi:MAG TPA: hypothetical protein VN317_08465, partial [Candidatus Methanoperedens sp.]|nr:hypothetical protein [Candidatus Methanoperedens sp.]
MRLRSRIALILVALVALPTVPTALALLGLMERSLRETIGGRLDELARTNAASIAAFLDESLHETRQIALLLPPAAIRARDAAAIEAALRVPVESFPRFQNGCFVLDGSGTLWA